MSVDSELIGRRVAEARIQANLTQVALARAIGLDRSALAKIETGARRITALELARVAEQTGEAFDWFVTESPPAVVSYRSSTETSTTSDIDRLIEQLSRDVEVVQGLHDLDAATFETLERPEDVTGATQLAATARTMLGCVPQGPITDVTGPLAAFGLLAFSQDLGPNAPDAATTLLRNGGVTVINSGRAVGRRRLALAHEIGHYLLADAYTVDWRVGTSTSASARTEWILDVFARAFLVPGESLSARWAELRSRESIRDSAVRVASEYRVDMSTLAARLTDLELADDDTARVVRSTTTRRADIIEYDLFVATDLQGTTLPRRYEKAILTLYRAERISTERAIDLLLGTIDEGDLPTRRPTNENEIWKFVS